MSAWRQRTTGILIGGIVVIVLASAIAFMVGTFQPKTDLRLGTGVFSADLALDEASQKKGWSGMAELKPNAALIMRFDELKTAGIWMKGMSVPIDVLWLNDQKKVVYIVKNIPVEPNDETYQAPEPVRYVIELPAGSVEQYTIRVGETAVFSLASEGK